MPAAIRKAGGCARAPVPEPGASSSMATGRCAHPCKQRGYQGGAMTREAWVPVIPGMRAGAVQLRRAIARLHTQWILP